LHVDAGGVGGGVYGGVYGATGTQTAVAAIQYVPTHWAVRDADDGLLAW
jgi:hypothetical protein